MGTFAMMIAASSAAIETPCERLALLWLADRPDPSGKTEYAHAALNYAALFADWARMTRVHATQTFEAMISRGVLIEHGIHYDDNSPDPVQVFEIIGCPS